MQTLKGSLHYWHWALLFPVSLVWMIRLDMYIDRLRRQAVTERDGDKALAYIEERTRYEQAGLSMMVGLFMWLAALISAAMM